MRWVSLRVSGVLAAAIGLSGGCGDDDGGGDGGTGNATDGATAADGGPDGMDDDDTTGPPPPDMGLMPPSICEDACAARAACGESAVACENQCDADHANFAEGEAGCLSDYEALLSCTAGLSCDELAMLDDPPMDAAYPCEAESDAFTLSCLLDGEPPPPTCDAWCAVMVECTDISAAECPTNCAMYLSYAEGLGTECLDATVAQLDCVGTLDCPGYEEFDLQEGEFPCQAETEMADAACGM